LIFCAPTIATLTPAPSVGLNNNVQLLASITDAIAKIAEAIKEMLKR